MSTNRPAKFIVISSILIGVSVYLVFGQKVENIFRINSVSQLAKQHTETKCLAQENTTVVNVIDGDTVIVEGGSHVRLTGINAEEKGEPCYEVAKIGLESLVLHKQVRLEKDISETDQYGRCLRTLFIGDQNVNLQLIKEGLAVAVFYPPDGKYKEEFAQAQGEATKKKMGCQWGNI